jgi:hypothetical protein
MKTYSVSIPWHCEVLVKVQAKNKKQALKLAYDKADSQVCCHCSDHIQMSEANDDCKPDIVEIEE